jgi:hypothetical protein
MEFLLVAEEKIASSETSIALRAFERLLFGMGPLMAFQVF